MALRSNSCLQVVAVAVLSFLFQPEVHAGPTGRAEIRGRITECWEGKHRPVTDLRVYVLTMEESKKIRHILEEMKQLPHADPQQYVHSKLYDEMIAEAKALGEQKGKPRTTKDGSYNRKNLHAGVAYLVLAIDWDRDDSDNLGFFEYSLVDNLRPGVNTLNLYMGPGEDRDCGS